MASITKRGDTWQYKVNRIVDGIRKPITKSGFRTKREAQLAAQEIELSLKKGDTVNIEIVSFSEYFERWIELYKSSTHINTLSRYYNSLNTVKEHFAHKPLKSITRSEYQHFLNEYGKGRARDTVRKLNTHIRACLKDAIEEGYANIDFTRKAQFNGTKETKNDDEKHINLKESEKLYHALFDKLTPSTTTYHLILLALVTGLRFGELTGLTKDCFDFKDNKIKIYRAWDYKRGTGFTDLKNEQSKRTISVDDKVMFEFKKLLVALPQNNYDLIFYRNTSIKTVTNEGANKLLLKLLKSLEIETITMHGLRHTHASVLLYKGANIHSVAKRLGHSDIQTTMEHYAHVIKEMEVRDEQIAVSLYSS